MEFVSDQLLARSLLTVNVLGYSLGPAIVDFSPTHATNPLWTPHARFHVVWQVLTGCGIGLIVLGMIWINGPSAATRLWIAVAINAAVYIAFFATALSMSRFAGRVSDTNGVPPITTVQFAGKPVALDTNVTLFCVQVALLLIAVLAMR